MYWNLRQIIFNRTFMQILSFAVFLLLLITSTFTYADTIKTELHAHDGLEKSLSKRQQTADHQPVHNLLNALKVEPYQDFNKNPMDHFFEEYSVQLIISFVIFLMLNILAVYIFTINRQLVKVKKEQDKTLDELEKRVADRTQDLLASKEQAESANKAKTEFLTHMSHELRTPMNAVLGFAQLLELEAEKRQLTQMSQNIGEILFAGGHLLELINDVLDLSNIESGKYQLEIKPVLVNKIMGEVLRLLETQAKEKEITISYKTEVDDQLEIFVDQRSLKQILINIISNAIKYNHPDGCIDIAIHKQDNGYCKFSVTDNGDGIAKELLNTIFDPFQRVTSRTDVSGSGVGLAITKNLVEAMDGEIQVESTLGEGSTFTVLFKLVS